MNRSATLSDQNQKGFRGFHFDLLFLFALETLAAEEQRVSARESPGEGAMILGKVPYRGYHLVLLQHKETFQIRVLDGRNNDVQLSLLTHAAEEDALEEARRKVDSIVRQGSIE